MKVWSLLVSSCLIAVSATAQAQSTPSNGVAAEADNSTEIIVTAQRRPERLQNVPLSVTAVSAEALKARGLNDLAQVSLAAPSLQISNDNNFAIRGVGTASFSNSIESSVAFAQDEVNLTNPGLITDFYDLSQVEVLNGPQGLLFGRNASAGLLNVTTTKPELGKFGGTFDLELDHRDTTPDRSNGVVVRGAVNVPLGDKAALRVSAYDQYQQPLVAFAGPVNGRNELDMRRFGVRAKLLVEPTDSLSLYIIGEHGEERGVLGLFDTTYRQLGAGSGNAAPLASVGVTAGPENAVVTGDAGYYRDLNRDGLQGKVTYTLGNGIEISNITAWKKFTRTQQLDTDGTPLDGANVNFNDTRFEQFSNEFRVALPSGNRLSGQAGVYYFHSSLNENGRIAGNLFFPSFILPGFPFCVGGTAAGGCSTSNVAFLGNDHNVHQTNESLAAFGQLTYKVTDQFQIIAGGRVTHDKLAINLTQNQLRYFVTLGIPFVGTERFSNTNFSYKLGAQYNFTRDAMVYATFGRGYKGPGFNNNAVSGTVNGVTAVQSLVVRPETNRNIEVGAKTSWLDRHLTVNLSLFHSRFNNYQIQALDLSSSSFVTQNAATVTSKGAELSVMAKPVKGLTVNASATLLDSTFGNFAGAQCYPSQGCVTFNAAGRRTPLAPKFTGTIDASYEFNADGSVRPFVSANLYHRSSIEYNVAPAPGTHFAGVDILGLSAGVRGDNWRASVFCKNCTDKRVPVAIGIDAGDSFSGITSYNQHFGLNSFRTIGLQLGYNF